ncbi:MAG: DUF5667 domain-containing protein [Patescibacteria group bacterium]|nr:DUF5667 domain-containing protein [Patescibacteria group bacterium]
MRQEKEVIKLLKQCQKIKANRQWVEQDQAHLLAYFREKFPPTAKGVLFYLKPVFTTLMILVVVLLSGYGFLKAAERSLPGEPLYPLKRASEKIIFQLSPSQEKPVLRAEIVQKRLKESKQLASRGGVIDSKISPQLSKTVIEFQKEFVSLKKEIGLPVKEEILFSPDLPIQDNKKIVALIQNQDLEKLLAETKEALKEKKVEAVLEKTMEVEKIIVSSSEEKKEEQVPSEEPIIEERKPETLESLPATGSLVQPKKIEKPTDFKIAPIQETNSFKTDLLRE